MLSAGLAKRGADLLHHQCWAWGADVRRPEGNLLLRYGFERAALGQARRYVLGRGGRTIVLWPFGLAFADPCRVDGFAVFVERFSFQPRRITPASVATAWSSTGLEDIAGDECGAAAALDGLVSAVRWMEAYERWVRGVAGHAYRGQTLLDWEHSTLSGEALRRGWECLARDLTLYAASARMAEGVALRCMALSEGLRTRRPRWS